MSNKKLWSFTVIKLIFNSLGFIFPCSPLSHLRPLNQTMNSPTEQQRKIPHTSSETIYSLCLEHLWSQNQGEDWVRSTLVLPKVSVTMHCRIWKMASTKMNIWSWWIPYAETKATFPCKCKITHRSKPSTIIN